MNLRNYKSDGIENQKQYMEPKCLWHVWECSPAKKQLAGRAKEALKKVGTQWTAENEVQHY